MQREGGSPSSLDLLISGKIYLGGRLVDAAVGVQGGKVAWLGKPALAPPAERKVEAGDGTIVLPGMVDMHVHMRDLGEAEKEDWFTGTMSALAGGVTFVADMPNNKPPARSVEVLKAKEAEAARKAVVDYGFYIGLPAKDGELARATEFGVIGMKLYPEDFLAESLVSALKEAAKLEIPVVVHAEDPLLLQMARLIWEKSFEFHGKLRPAEAEAQAVRAMAYLARYLGFRLHLTHLSSAKGLEAALEAKLRAGATIDTAIHYLVLSEKLARRLKGLAKVNPPLRSHRDAVTLRRAVAAGLLDAIVTDHAPHRLEEKLSGEYSTVPAGFPGLELCLPLLVTMVLRGVLPLEALSLYACRPADILGVPKGRLEVGMDADIVFLNVKEKWRIRGSELRSKAKYTPFEGFEVSGKVQKVFIRGVPAYDTGELLVDRGFGRRYGRGGGWGGE